MKLCQKCKTAIDRANREDLPDEGWTSYHLEGKVVTDSECQFWAHRELRAS